MRSSHASSDTRNELTMISIGATLGTGIFVVLGDAVPEAGPAVTLAFVIAGLTALFSALSYAELAGSIPVAGSSVELSGSGDVSYSAQRASNSVCTAVSASSPAGTASSRTSM